MTRPSLDTVLLEVARVIALRSTCDRLHVGAVIARDTRVISTGYNGNMAGSEHCQHDCDCFYLGDHKHCDAESCQLAGLDGHAPDCRSRQPCSTAVHAEVNALAFAARHGVPTLGAHVYCTHAPCASCARLLVNAGITAVTFGEPYRSDEGLAVLQQAGITTGTGAQLRSLSTRGGT